MSMLLVLLLMQVVGIILCAIVFCYEYLHQRRTVYVSHSSHLPEHFDAEGWPWLSDYFESHPDSSLKDAFPDTYKIAIAVKRYKELNRLRQSGLLSTKRYEKRLKKVLYCVDIKDLVGVS